MLFEVFSSIVQRAFQVELREIDHVLSISLAVIHPALLLSLIRDFTECTRHITQLGIAD